MCVKALHVSYIAPLITCQPNEWLSGGGIKGSSTGSSGGHAKILRSVQGLSINMWEPYPISLTLINFYL